LRNAANSRNHFSLRSTRRRKCKDNDFGVYEDDWGELPEPTSALGIYKREHRAFTIVSTENMRYEEYIEMQMEMRFKREEADYRDYTRQLYASWVAGFHLEYRFLNAGVGLTDWSGRVRTLV
jgi:hypothetical protein